MDWFKQSLIFAIFASGLCELCLGSSHSNLQTAQHYEQCVVGKVSKLSIFTEEDRMRMNKIVLETGVRMHKLRADPMNAVNSRTMLRLFTAALANVIADGDSSLRTEREKACISALETCAEDLSEPAGLELVYEITKIFAMIDGFKSHPNKKNNQASISSTHEEDCLENSSVKISSEEKKRSKRAFNLPSGFSDSIVQFQSNPALESVIADSLLKSPNFINTFKSGISQQDAIYYSTEMVAASLDYYSYDIINEAYQSVTNAISTIGFMEGAEDYAFAIARSIASVLGAHQLAFFADGNSLGRALVFKLDNMLGFAPGLSNPTDFGFSASSSAWGTASVSTSFGSGAISSFQTNPANINPSFTVPFNAQNGKVQFQNDLSYFLSQSEALSNAICNGYSLNYYNVVNSALFDYGLPVSSIAATIISNSLSMLPTEAACTQHADIISEVITDIFDSNGLLTVADPQVIANKIASNINANLRTNTNQPQNTQNVGQQSFSGVYSDLQLNPSFTDYSFPAVSFDQRQFPAENTSSGNQTEFETGPIQAFPPISNIQTPVELQSPTDQPTIMDISNKKETVELPIVSNISEQMPPFQISVVDLPITNTSTIIENIPSNISIPFGKLNQTKGPVTLPVAPVVLEPGPVISGDSKKQVENGPGKKDSIADYDTTPAVAETTKAPELTTPFPLSTENLYSTTSASISETTTTVDPYLSAVDDVLVDPSKLSGLLLDEIYSALEDLNVTIKNEKIQPGLPVTLENGGFQSSDQPKAEETIIKTAEPVKDSEESGPSNVSEVKLQPTSDTPTTDETPSNATSTERLAPDKTKLDTDSGDKDSSTPQNFPKNVASVVSSSIAFIRSDNFQLSQLCERLNELATIFALPPLDYCSEVPLIDYLLHVLDAFAARVSED